MRNNKPELRKIKRRIEKIGDMASSTCGFEKELDALFCYEEKTMRFIDECLSKAYSEGLSDGDEHP